MTKGKDRGIGSLFLRPAEPDQDRDDRPPPARASSGAPASSSAPPEMISSLIPGGGAVQSSRRASARPVVLQDTPSASPASVSGPSSAVLALVEEVRKHVPTGNATMKLMETMRSLQDFIEDPVKRKAAALKTLEGQGVSENDIAAGTREVEQAIDRCLDELLSQSATVRTEKVDGKRSQADELRRQAAELQAQMDEHIRRATSLESEANALEGQLDLFRTDVTSARSLARESYGV